MPDPQMMWLKLLPTFNEAQVRWYAAQKAVELGHGGIEQVHRLTGLSRPTIRKGIRELLEIEYLDATAKVRRAGAGRKRVEVNDPALLQALERILEETTVGDPMSALRWTAKSVRTLAQELTHQGHPVSRATVDRLLHDLGYSLQVNQKTKEGSNHPDRDAQFRYINEALL